MPSPRTEVPAAAATVDPDTLDDTVRRAARLLLDLDRFTTRLRVDPRQSDRVRALERRMHALRRMVICLTTSGLEPGPH